MSKTTAEIIVDGNTQISGSEDPGLDNPLDIEILENDRETVYVADRNRDEIVQAIDENSIVRSISVLLTLSQYLCQPTAIHIDPRNGNHIYTSHKCYSQFILFTNMQSTNPRLQVVAGDGSSGPTLCQIEETSDIIVDRNKNIRC